MMRLRRGYVPRVALSVGVVLADQRSALGEDLVAQPGVGPRPCVAVTRADHPDRWSVSLYHGRVRSTVDADRQTRYHDGLAFNEPATDARCEQASSRRRSPGADDGDRARGGKQ